MQLAVAFACEQQADVRRRAEGAECASVGPREVLVRWNASWIPPTASWLDDLAGAWPGVVAAPTTYAERYRDVSVFSWKGVVKIFADAAATGKLRVPLALVEGRATLRFDDDDLLVAVRDDVYFAEELRRGRLRNRRCA